MWEFIINVNNVTVLFLGFNEEAKEVLIEDPLTGQVLEEFEQLGHNHLHELYHDTDFCKKDGDGTRMSKFACRSSKLNGTFSSLANSLFLKK